MHSTYLGRDPALLVKREGGMGAFRTAQDRSRYIGALQMTPMNDPPGVAVGGEIDEDAYPGLVERLGELARGRDEVHVDLSAVRYCDLTGLRAIVRLATTGRTLVLHGLPEQLQTLLGILGWDNTPGLVIDNSPAEFRLPPANPDPETADVNTPDMPCR
jgi:anti-anti-sigma regulatory factor